MQNFINFNNPTLVEAIYKLDEDLKKQTPHSFIFLYLKDDSPKERILLRKIVKKAGALNTVIVSGNLKLAGLATTANVFHFIYLSEAELFPAFTLYRDRLMLRKGQGTSPKKLKIGFKGGIDVIDTNKICFCSADGNYTDIYLADGKKKTVTYQLNSLEKKLNFFPDFERIGKSFIINLNRVNKIKENSVYVNTDSEDLKLNLSPLYIKRLRKALTWY